MASGTLPIDWAAVLTLWATTVAGRLGFDPAEALSRGRAVAGLNAQAKDRRLGVFKPHVEKSKAACMKGGAERFPVELLGQAVPAVNTPDGIRAVAGGKPIQPRGVETHLNTWPRVVCRAGTVRAPEVQYSREASRDSGISPDT